MYMGLDQIIYGLAYRNHRYNHGKYNISFFGGEDIRDKFYNMYAEQVEAEIVKFEFCIKDLIKKESNATL